MHLENLQELHVPLSLKSYIVPSKREHTPLLPNFFTEVKGPDGNAAVLKRQITNDAAYGARGMVEMQSHGEDSRTYDGSAYTIGSTYHSGTGTTPDVRGASFRTSAAGGRTGLLHDARSL